jgi:hypothetical protein
MFACRARFECSMAFSIALRRARSRSSSALDQVRLERLAANPQAPALDLLFDTVVDPRVELRDLGRVLALGLDEEDAVQNVLCIAEIVQRQLRSHGGGHDATACWRR